jgi:hypothetical protein
MVTGRNIRYKFGYTAVCSLSRVSISWRDLISANSLHYITYNLCHNNVTFSKSLSNSCDSTGNYVSKSIFIYFKMQLFLWSYMFKHQVHHYCHLCQQHRHKCYSNIYQLLWRQSTSFCTLWMQQFEIFCEIFKSVRSSTAT